jgi:hypothetical protein
MDWVHFLILSVHYKIVVIERPACSQALLKSDGSDRTKMFLLHVVRDSKQNTMNGFYGERTHLRCT